MTDNHPAYDPQYRQSVADNFIDGEPEDDEEWQKFCREHDACRVKPGAPIERTAMQNHGYLHGTASEKSSDNAGRLLLEAD